MNDPYTQGFMDKLAEYGIEGATDRLYHGSVDGYGREEQDPEDVYVHSAIPRGTLKSVLRHGLMSSEAMLKNPEVLEAVLKSRKGLEWEETEEEFRARVEGKLKDKFWADAMKGPSVFFGEPDPDKITDKHPMRKMRSEKIRINLSKLLAALPDTRVAGSELKPYDPKGPRYQGHLRHRDLDLDEVRGYSKIDPKELWKHYNEPEGRRYASDVPHAQIVTPSGVIPSEYIEKDS
jgi:hypothetical protein